MTSAHPHPWLTWFCVWQSDQGLHVPDGEAQALLTLARGLAGVHAAHVMRPTQAHDPHYPAPQGSPSLILQLECSDLLALEDHLTPTGALAPLVLPALLPSLDGATPAQQAMLTRVYHVPCPALLPAESLTYWVEYEGPAEDANAWHVHYNAHHPRLLAQLPGIRSIEIYTPAIVTCALPLPTRACLQRNKTVFDSPEAMNAAMASPVRELLRADFRSLPPFEGASHHFPFRTLTWRQAGGSSA